MTESNIKNLNYKQNTELLRVEKLEKKFPVYRGLIRRIQGFVHAVNGVSFTINAGQTLGLVGESGCGKSTLGRLILRLIEPTSGLVIFDGDNLIESDKNKLKLVRQKI